MTFPSALDVVALVDEGLGNSSYLVDTGDGRALVVDPSRDPRPYLSAARARHLRLAWSVETHLHADFVSGSRELAAYGSDIVAPAASRLAFSHKGLRDDEELELGGLILRAVATPGHTAEHLSYLLLDDGRPVALFSGGALIPGGIGRPDLLGADLTEPLARAAYRSVHNRLLVQPPDLVVYPTHGPGSFCTLGPGLDRTTTIGTERRTHPVATAPDEDAFVRRLLDGLGSHPPYFLRLGAVNRRGAIVHHDDRPQLARLRPDEIAGLVASGSLLVDVRPFEAYATGHIPGSLSIPLRHQFATWLGWLVPVDRPLLFILGHGQDRDELVTQCLKVGYERLTGEVAGGVSAWQADGRQVAITEVIEPDAINGRAVLDVRQHTEWHSGHLPGAWHVELGDLDHRAGELPDRPLVAHCAHGDRAITAASLLVQHGRGDVAVMRGGPDDWAARVGASLRTP